MLRLCMLLGLMVLVGCSAEARKVKVSGKVTLDGNPLSEGQLMFVDPDGKIAPEQTTIDKGTYTVDIPPGTRKVQITAWREGKGKEEAVMGNKIPEQYLPGRYNDKTELTAKVEDHGTQVIDFPLVSGKK